MEYKEHHDGTARHVTISDASVAEVIQLLTVLKFPAVDIVQQLSELKIEIKNLRRVVMAFEDVAIQKLTEQKTIADGVKTLLEQLTILVEAIPATDPAVAAKQAQILTLIDSNSQEVSDAIVANTPAAVPPPPDPNPAG